MPTIMKHTKPASIILCGGLDLPKKKKSALSIDRALLGIVILITQQLL